MSTDSERYVFEAEWHDKVACITRNFLLYYYLSDNSVELYDLKTRKTFLRKTKCEGVDESNFYVGAVVTIFARSMKLISFADFSTKTRVLHKIQKTLGIIMPELHDKIGEILKRILAENFKIGNLKMVHLSREDAMDFFREKGDNSTLMLSRITSGPIIALELLGQDCISRWLELIGSNDISEIRETDSPSLSAFYEKYAGENTFYGSISETADQDIKFFFPDPKSEKRELPNTSTIKDCTCCIIKPHAVQSRLEGDIIDEIIKNGYLITAMQLFHVDPVNVEEFLEVYKGVLPDYGAMVAELQSGPCIAMEIKHKDESVNVPVEFRKFCGPMDPEIAKHVRPDTLRAKYGKTKVQNAVHCSDLPEDGILEYFFKILS
ncbi:nucleoside diphosphate kinase 7 isoform X2 [Leptopilina boulardi]|uniref:nucleoside diphosphate kinase 7 isoform X2 n=1 Tax=Leptopilina boulardi TaxID=63433 RepID=UPI0021F5A304|nr:nucleoside diphosphate kinase 7 isoform X2 [Leptopilina boulardi]